MSLIASTPKPPYYAVIFTSLRTDGDDGYSEMAKRMEKLAAKQPGFLGIESVRENLGITVSYWDSLEAIKHWKANLEHQEAQKSGRDRWYSAFKVRIAKVERDYGSITKKDAPDVASQAKIVMHHTLNPFGALK